MTTTPLIAVIDYGAGNLPNVVRALRHVGARLEVTDDPARVRAAPIIVFPGVGATCDTMQSLAQRGLIEAIRTAIADRKPFLGICVAMQILCTTSEEFGTHACLDIVPGVVRRLPDDGQKVPQIGWNSVHMTARGATHPIFESIADGSDFYFVHSYYCAGVAPDLVAAESEYGLRFPCVLARDHLAAVQFHPEKSGRCGLRLLHNFVSWSAQSVLQSQ